MHADNPLPPGAAETAPTHFTTTANFKDEARAVVHAMVDLITKHAKDGRQTYSADLKKRFTAAQITAHWPEAVRIAHKGVVRDVNADLSDEAAAIEAAPTLVERMVKVIVARVGRDKSAVAALQQAGFAGTEIAANIDEAMRLANRQLGERVPANASLVNLAYALGRMVRTQAPAAAGAQ